METKLYNILNSGSRKSLIYNIAISIALSITANLIVFSFGWNMQRDRSFPIPGYIIGSVWIMLFTLMGIARWSLNKDEVKNGQAAKNWISVLILACAFYVFLLSFKSQFPGVIGNFLIIFLAFYCVRKAYPASMISGLLIIPVIVWVIFATVITFFYWS